jgi:hypothetical protein
MPRRTIKRLEVGQVYDDLTVLQVRPCLLICSCGEYVKNRNVSHLRAGIKSCGCKQRSSGRVNRGELRKDIKNVTLITCGVTKTKYKVYLVTCVHCGQDRTLCHASLLYEPGTYGCRMCYRTQKKVRAYGLEPETRGGYPGGGGTMSSRSQATRGHT